MSLPTLRGQQARSKRADTKRSTSDTGWQPMATWLPDMSGRCLKIRRALHKPTATAKGIWKFSACN